MLCVPGGVVGKVSEEDIREEVVECEGEGLSGVRGRLVLQLLLMFPALSALMVAMFVPKDKGTGGRGGWGWWWGAGRGGGWG